MIKKLVAVIVAASAALGTVAFADSIKGVLNGDSIVIDANDKNCVILNGYDENGILKASELFASENGEFHVPSKLAEYKLRAVFTEDGSLYDVELEEAPAETAVPEATASPAPTEAPEATAVPTVKPTSSPKTFPAIYEREIDAVNAFAVVKNVSIGENDNGEECYYIDTLYQGREFSVEVDESVAISSASDAFSYMKGADARALNKGDVIYFSANLSGKINNISLIYRPLDTNIVTDGVDYGNSFSKLISDNGNVAGKSGWSVLSYGKGNGSGKYQFAFGPIMDKSTGELVLIGADGNENDALYLSIEKDTIVYVCDMAAKREVSIGNVGNLVKSAIPKNAADSNGKITYSDSYKTNYALVRTVNGTATDIVIYTNYNK
ncbi:MAG: hypothetical protein ACI4C7_03175 [Clostridia bacterium]